MDTEKNTFHEKAHSSLDKKIFWHFTTAHVIVLFLMGVSLTLHLININTIGDANLYYTAAVKSMLQSWDNFFFAAAEPGGSVTVDKPPLGLWIEALSALIFGVNGFAVSLPNILAGVFSLPILFVLVRKQFGSLAGIISVVVYTITPIVLATDRNNTIDGMLVFTLLLAAWAFTRATDKGRLSCLILGSILIGLGFNIKMLQAYLVLPAFLLLFLLGTQIRFRKRILYLGISVVVIIAVSLSWALIVDLTPTGERPYVGSSENNSVLELIIGHNGLSRLIGKGKNPYGLQDTSSPAPGLAPDSPPQSPLPPQDAPFANNTQIPGQPPRGGQPPPQPGGNAFANETGTPGIFRLFKEPIGKEMSWLLPFALFSMIMLAFSEPISFRKMTLSHKGIILWGGWLLTCAVFFSIADFYHAYYMIMLAPPLAALVGAGFAWLSDFAEGTDWKKGALVFALLLTLIFQIYLALEYIAFSPLLLIAASISVISSAVLLFSRKHSVSILFSIILFTSSLLIPMMWTIQTVLEENPHSGLPSAFAGESGGIQRQPDPEQEDPRQEKLLEFLSENTQEIEYLVAVSNANTGAPFVLATGRPVLYMGGFTGSDPVVDTEDIIEMVSDGDLRYFYYQNIDQEKDQEIKRWLRDSCSVVKEFSEIPQRNQRQDIPRNQPTTILFDCING
ncbi:MAG: glycosyltransferase family 39 protein [Pelolinea sp.]|nr:glycosyltransferase family 39 protein [Pelolinea sp.]